MGNEWDNKISNICDKDKIFKAMIVALKSAAITRYKSKAVRVRLEFFIDLILTAALWLAQIEVSD
jgi:hypothetical protein